MHSGSFACACIDNYTNKLRNSTPTVLEEIFILRKPAKLLAAVNLETSENNYSFVIYLQSVPF